MYSKTIVNCLPEPPNFYIKYKLSIVNKEFVY